MRLVPDNGHGLGAFVDDGQLHDTAFRGWAELDVYLVVFDAFSPPRRGDQGVLIAEMVRRAACAQAQQDEESPQGRAKHSVES